LLLVPAHRSAPAAEALTEVNGMLASALFAVASAVLCAGPVTLPFRDGFESTPSFSAWTGAQVDGANAMARSDTERFEGNFSLLATYAGNSNFAAASPTIDFNSTNAVFVRFWLYVPTGTAASMAAGTYISLADGPTNGVADTDSKVRLWLNKASNGALFIDLDYDNSKKGSTLVGDATKTPVAEGRWLVVGFSYEAARATARVFIDDLVTPKATSTSTDKPAHALQTLWLGIANSATSNARVQLYFDDISVSVNAFPSTPDAGVADSGVFDAGSADAGQPAPDAGSPGVDSGTEEPDSGPSETDAGTQPIDETEPGAPINDAGTVEVPNGFDEPPFAPLKLRVGCQCQDTPGLLLALLAAAVLRVSRRGSR
jgi:hypothetical protein